MMKRTFSLALLTTGLFFNSSSFAAVVNNGSFENQGFTSWSTAGNTAVQGALGGIPPISVPNGSNQAVLNSGDGSGADASIPAAALETFLDLGAGGLSGVGPVAFRGSAIKQSLTSVSVGDILTFSWNFLTNEATPSPQNDFSFFSVSRVGGGPTAQLLANTNSNFTAINASTFAEQTGYQQRSFTFTVAGDYTLGFGVVNTDPFASSALLVDNVSITAVPEPTCLASLMVLGGTVLTLRRRRKR